MKVVVAGNCQARPLSQLLTRLNPHISITATPIVHLLKAEDEVKYRPELDEANIIITQLIADNYPCEFIRTSKLTSLYGDKVKTILNLYFTGYTPDLVYLRHPQAGTLRGPIGEYHNRTILTGWMLGVSEAQVVSWLNDPFYNAQEYAAESSRSISELNAREKSVDVPIVDYIEANLQTQRLFFTFNHPSAPLLMEYATRISDVMLGRKPKALPLSNVRELLDQLIPRSPPGLGLNREFNSQTKGQEVLSISGAQIELGKEKHYTDEELVALFYKIYDENAEFIREKYDT